MEESFPLSGEKAHGKQANLQPEFIVFSLLIQSISVTRTPRFNPLKSNAAI